MVRHPSHSAIPSSIDHLTELETCIKILKHLPPSERPAMLDRINHKVTSLSQNDASPSLSSSQRQPSQNRSDNNNEQQQLSTIERLVSARAELEAYAGKVPNMQPLIKKQMVALGRAWPIVVQDTERKGELGTSFAKLRGGPIDKDQDQPRGLDSMKAAQGDKEQHHSQELETMLARMREAQTQEDQEESRKLEDFFARLRGAQEDEDQQLTHEVEAAVASMRVAQRREDQEQSRELAAAVARMQVADHFAELGLFEGSMSSNPPQRQSFLLTFAKIGFRDTDNYLSISGLQYCLLFDAAANSYTVQEFREVAVIPAVQRSDKLSFHINAIRSVDHKARGSEVLRVGVKLESGKEVSLVFEKAEDRMVFLKNVYQKCPALD